MAIFSEDRKIENDLLIFQLVIENLGMGVVACDQEGKFTIFNKKAENLLGIGATDTKKEMWSEKYGVFYPDQKTIVPTEQLPLVLAVEGKSTDNMELFIRNDFLKEGIYVNVTGRPILGRDDSIEGGVVVFEDITQRKKNEKKIIAYNKQLRETQAKIVQQEKMAAIGQLAAGVAHEINNPVGFVSSNLRTLGKYVNKISNFMKEQTEILKKVGNQDEVKTILEKSKKLKIDYISKDLSDLIEESLDGTDRVKKIVKDLKNFSRVDESEHQMADVNHCIDSTLNIVWNELKYKAHLKKELGDIPQTKCYPRQLNQVFMNLLVNASHAIESKGNIDIKTWSDKKSIFISISDTGSGIPKEIEDRLFEPFFTTKEAGKGTGLGLSISKDIIKKHKGDIRVESEVGKGTIFTICIPIVEEYGRE